ncbi:MAG: TldD/PmbA family protein [Bacilli bacterium]
MNSKKFFELAKENDIQVSQISTHKSTKLSFSLFHGEIDSYSLSDTSTIAVRGIYKGKMGSAKTEKDDKNTPLFLVHAIKDGASYIEKVDPSFIFEGSKKYHNKNLFSKELEKVSVETKIAKLHELESKLKGADKRVTEVQVTYVEVSEESTIKNTYGINLKQRGNYFYFYAEQVAKDGEEIKSDGDIYFGNNFEEFNVDNFVKKITDKVTSKFHGTPIPGGTYKAVLKNEVVNDLLNAYIRSFSSEEIQKHSSLIEGKLNTKIASSKITIEEKPLTKNIFFKGFDDEGVATINKKIVDHGVVKTYLYNLETAAKDKVETTANGYGGNGKIGIDVDNLSLKPGKLTEEELFEKIENGVYITSITGLHAGLNATSGDFSLEAEGYHVENRKKKGSLSLITVGGNLFKLFDSVIAVGNNSELFISSSSSPAMAIRGLKVSS